MLSHIFRGYRGVQSFANMADLSLRQNLSAILRALSAIDRQLFGGILTVLLLLSVLSLLRAMAGGRKPFGKLFGKPFGKPLSPHGAALLCCLGTCLLYFLTVARIAVSDDLKYFSPMYGVLFCAAADLLGRLCRRVLPKRRLLLFLLILLLAMGNS